VTKLLATAAAAILFLVPAAALAETKGEALERKTNEKIDADAAKKKQEAREKAETNATNTGFGRERQIQEKEAKIDAEAAQKKKDYAEARKKLDQDKLKEPADAKKDGKGK